MESFLGRAKAKLTHLTDLFSTKVSPWAPTGAFIQLIAAKELSRIATHLAGGANNRGELLTARTTAVCYKYRGKAAVVLHGGAR
jgi:hypothetical protein